MPETLSRFAWFDLGQRGLFRNVTADLFEDDLLCLDTNGRRNVKMIAVRVWSSQQAGFNVGHASAMIGKTYVSWWPSEGNDWKQSARYCEELARAIAHS